MKDLRDNCPAESNQPPEIWKIKVNYSSKVKITFWDGLLYSNR